MKSHYQQIKPYWDLEIAAAEQSKSIGDIEEEFKHLERAHILGQNSTLLHTKTHILMMFWGIRQSNIQELAGQVFRIFGAVTKTIFGQIPSGNTGGSNVSPFKRTPISPELQLIINASQAKL